MHEGPAEGEHAAANTNRNYSLYVLYSWSVCKQANERTLVNMQCFR